LLRCSRGCRRRGGWRGCARRLLSRDGLEDQSFAAETGGLSGRPLFARATRMLAHVYKLTDGKLPLIGVGGIDSGAAAVAKVRAGASLLQLYTGLVFEGPKLIGDINQALLNAMQEAKTESLGALVGSEADSCATLEL
jgi:dihydroorotate dehydrogenase